MFVLLEPLPIFYIRDLSTCLNHSTYITISSLGPPSLSVRTSFVDIPQRLRFMGSLDKEGCIISVISAKEVVPVRGGASEVRQQGAFIGSDGHSHVASQHPSSSGPSSPLLDWEIVLFYLRNECIRVWLIRYNPSPPQFSATG